MVLPIVADMELRSGIEKRCHVLGDVASYICLRARQNR
jgi:hypothetical protein